MCTLIDKLSLAQNFGTRRSYFRIFIFCFPSSKKLYTPSKDASFAFIISNWPFSIYLQYFCNEPWSLPFSLHPYIHLCASSSFEVPWSIANNCIWSNDSFKLLIYNSMGKDSPIPTNFGILWIEHLLQLRRKLSSLIISK